MTGVQTCALPISDLLRGVITSIRTEIENLGGEVHFNTALTGLQTSGGALCGITTTAGSIPVSYTHLDVYKRQVQVRLVQRRHAIAYPGQQKAHHGAR